MPQMSPMPWTIIFIMTLITMLMINNSIYFYTYCTMNKTTLNHTPKFKIKW